jgi:hypothetical protein
MIHMDVTYPNKRGRRMGIRKGTLGPGRSGLIIVCLLLRLLVLSSAGASAETVDVAYSFHHKQGGGIAMVSVDTKTGRFVDSKTLLADKECRQPEKVRRTADGQTLLLTNETSKGPHLFLVPGEGAAEWREVDLPGQPDEARVVGDFALVTCDNDSLAWVDLQRGTVAKVWDAEKQLTPPGNAPQDVLILEGGREALVSFQKDSNKGKKLGSRLVLLSLPDLTTLVDVPLPRSRPDLHIRGNRQEQGPSPEVLLFSKSANSLVVTLDLYGAVALLDWPSVRAGAVGVHRYLSTSLDGSWGNAFPDRAKLIELKGRPFVLIFNAGPEGGAVLVDITRGEIVRRWKTPPGLEKPVFLPGVDRAVTVRAGKIKQRKGSEVEKTYDPGDSVYVFDFSSGSDPAQFELRVLPQDGIVTAVTAIAGAETPIVLLATGREEANRLRTFDAAREMRLDECEAPGAVRRFEE